MAGPAFWIFSRIRTKLSSRKGLGRACVFRQPADHLERHVVWMFALPWPQPVSQAGKLRWEEGSLSQKDLREE